MITIIIIPDYFFLRENIFRKLCYCFCLFSLELLLIRFCILVLFSDKWKTDYDDNYNDYYFHITFDFSPSLRLARSVLCGQY